MAASGGAEKRDPETGRPSTLAIKTKRTFSTSRIVIMPKDGQEWSVVLGVKHVRIGAGGENDVIITDEHVSRYHCELRMTNEGWLLRDLGSTNGTRVGEVAIKEGLVSPGAVITVGATRIRFLAD